MKPNKTSIAKSIGLSLLIFIMLFLNNKLEATPFTDILVYGVVFASLCLINFEVWTLCHPKERKKTSEDASKDPTLD